MGLLLQDTPAFRSMALLQRHVASQNGTLNRTDCLKHRLHLGPQQEDYEHFVRNHACWRIVSNYSRFVNTVS